MSRRTRLCWLQLAVAVSCAITSPGFAEDDRAREHYVLHCSGCHRLDGAGVPGTTPTLHGLGTLLEYDAGRAYLGAVPGVSQAPLGDADLAALLNWVVVTFSGAGPARPYTGDEMRRLRAAPLRDPLSARAAIPVPSIHAD